MATIVLGTIGGIVGGPTGQAIGTLIGAGIEGSRSPTQELNRLKDLRVSGSTFGTPIPIIYGTHQVSGNCIWAGVMRETSKKTGVRLMGTRRRTFSYTISLALSWCRGPISRMKRIWADDLLIYDSTVIDPSGPYDITNYLGTEWQGKDPTIEADKGTTNTPAFRGQAYSVLKDLPLSAFGNRIPNFKAEVEAVYSSLIYKSEPLMYYQFEDTPGKLQDSGSSAYHLTDTGGTSTQLAGKVGEGISIPLNVSLQRTVGQVAGLQDGTMTAEGWYQYKGDPVVNGGGHFSYVNPNTAEEAWDLFVSPNVATAHIDIRCRIVTNAEGVTVIHQVQVARDTNWHHVVWTYDDAGESRVYHDGVLLDTETTLIDQGIVSDAANHLFISGNDIRWDELAFYGTVLDAETSSEHYAAEVQLRHIVADVARQVGLTNSQLSLAAANDPVRGYLVSGRTEARSALAPLLQVFFTDLAEVDGLIKAVKRGGSAVAKREIPVKRSLKSKSLPYVGGL